MSHGNHGNHGHGMPMPMGNATNTTTSPTTMNHGDHGMSGGHGMMVSWLSPSRKHSIPIVTKLTLNLYSNSS